MDNIKYIKCPKCGHDIPVEIGYIEWCDKCGWNIRPYEIDTDKDIKYRVYKYMGKKLSKSLFEQLSARDNTKKMFSFQRILSYILSAVIYIVSICIMLLLTFGGVFLLIKGTVFNTEVYQYGYIVLGAFAFFIVYMLFPKYKKFKHKPVDKNEFKILYDIVDRITDKMHIKKIDSICISGDFNAFYYETFFKKERILTIGLPLFLILNKGEKTALISHELGHGANHDVSRSKFINSALKLLINWYFVFKPEKRSYELFLLVIFGPFLILLIPIRVLLSLFVLMFIYLLAVLSWRDSQRSEYLADYASIKMGGSEAAKSLLGKLGYADSYNYLLKFMDEYSYKTDIITEFRRRIGKVSKRELERIKRLEFQYLSSVDATHPPTLYRYKFAEANNCEPLVLITQEEDNIIEEKLLKLDVKECNLQYI